MVAGQRWLVFRELFDNPGPVPPTVTVIGTTNNVVEDNSATTRHVLGAPPALRSSSLSDVVLLPVGLGAFDEVEVRVQAGGLYTSNSQLAGLRVGAGADGLGGYTCLINWSSSSSTRYVVLDPSGATIYSGSKFNGLPFVGAAPYAANMCVVVEDGWLRVKTWMEGGSGIGPDPEPEAWDFEAQVDATGYVGGRISTSSNRNAFIRNLEVLTPTDTPPFAEPAQMYYRADDLAPWERTTRHQGVRDLFTASGTWVKPDDAKLLRVRVVGGGGGGGSGAHYAFASDGDIGGGGAGAGAGVSEMFLWADDLPAEVSVTVGTAGTGGAAVPTGNVGLPGTSGGTSSFGDYVQATGGGGGQAGIRGSNSRNNNVGIGLNSGGYGGFGRGGAVAETGGAGAAGGGGGGGGTNSTGSPRAGGPGGTCEGNGWTSFTTAAFSDFPAGLMAPSPGGAGGGTSGGATPPKVPGPGGGGGGAAGCRSDVAAGEVYNAWPGGEGGPGFVEVTWW